MKKSARKVTTFSLSLEAIRLLAILAEAKGLNKSAVLETLIRAESRELGLE